MTLIEQSYLSIKIDGIIVFQGATFYFRTLSTFQRLCFFTFTWVKKWNQYFSVYWSIFKHSYLYFYFYVCTPRSTHIVVTTCHYQLPYLTFIRRRTSTWLTAEIVSCCEKTAIFLHRNSLPAWSFSFFSATRKRWQKKNDIRLNGWVIRFMVRVCLETFTVQDAAVQDDVFSF